MRRYAKGLTADLVQLMGVGWCGVPVVLRVQARTVRSSEFRQWGFCKSLWAPGLERGVIHTPAKGMRFGEISWSRRVGSLSAQRSALASTFGIHSFGTWPGPKNTILIFNIFFRTYRIARRAC